jgi:hypothetical protein
MYRPIKRIQISQDEEEKEDRLQRMIEEHCAPTSDPPVNAYRNMRYKYGRRIDECISDMQKSIRLGKTVNALVSFFSCYNMRNLPWQDVKEKSRAQGCQTNAINRLIACAVEDVSLANPRLVRCILSALFKMSTRPDQVRDPYTLAFIIREMSLSPKSRFCSHASRAYDVKNRTYVKQHYPELRFSLDKIETFDSDQCFEWMSADAGSELPDDVLAEFICDKIKRDVRLKKYADDPEIFDVLFKAHRKLSIKREIMQYIIGLAHFLVKEGPQGDYVRNQLNRKEEFVITKDQSFEEFTGRLLRGDEYLFTSHPIDVESVDGHTSFGKSLGISKKIFRITGARVNNEVLFDPLLKTIYEDMNRPF